ncbi:hypothetical protein GF389_05155 [Candidatus Dojkabacteria bacterium]|nr:hypothetical protein [Candidatus Dojkabacteria bacterium]
MRFKLRIKYLFLFVLFLFGFVGGFTFYSYLGGEDDEIAIDDKESPVSYEYAECYLLLGSFANTKEGYSFTELANLEVQTNIEGFDQEGVYTGKDNLSFVKLTSKAPYEIVSEDENTLVLVSPEDADPRLKSFMVDGVSFWDIEQIQDYPLCQRKITEDIQERFELNGKYYSFNFSSMSSIYIAGETIPVRAVDRTWLHQTDNYKLLYDRYAYDIENSALSLIMLENPVKGDPEPCRGCMMFIADEQNVSALKELGFDAVGIGNHFGDGGRSALESTIEVFAENKLPLAGVSLTSAAEASKPQYLDMNAKKVAFFSADDVAAYYWIGDYEGAWGVNRYSGKSSSGGVGAVDHAKIQKDIASAKSEADLVVVMVSWGVEYTNKASAHQIEMAHSLIDAGADIIIGSHPHWVQQVEFYKDRPIFYSLGNFIFDQTNDGIDAHWSRTEGETRQGISLKLHFFGNDLKSVEIIPHKICGYDQAPGGESANKSHNQAWRVQSGELSYDEVDKMSESEGCVWYQPTPLSQGDTFYNDIWERLLEYSEF